MWDELIEFTKRRTAGRDKSHDWEHGVTVSNLSVEIFDQTNIVIDEVSTNDARTIVKVAGLLHDVPDYKYTDTEAECRVIEQFLMGYVEGWMVKVIVDICLNTSFSTEACGKLRDLGKFNILRHCVSDADKINALGLEGIKRCYTYKCKYHKMTLPDDDWPMEKFNDPFVIKNVIQHWHEKLKLLLPQGYIRTETAKKMALPLNNEMEIWISSWEKRISMDGELSDYQIMLNAKDPAKYCPHFKTETS